MADQTPSPSRFSASTVGPYVFASLLALGALAWFRNKPDATPVVPIPIPSIGVKWIDLNAQTGAMTKIALPDAFLKAEQSWWPNLDSQAGKLQTVMYSDHVMICPQTDGTLSLTATSYAAGDYTFYKWRIHAGKGPFPPPVDPKPTPTPPIPLPPSPLEISMQSAFSADTDPQKTVNVLKFADILDKAVASAQKSGTVKTAKQFTDYVHGETNAAIGANALPKVRLAVAAYLSSVLPRDPQASFTTAYTDLAAREHSAVASALKGVK